MGRADEERGYDPDTGKKTFKMKIERNKAIQ